VRTVGVDSHFEVSKQAGSVLHFVNDHRARMAQQEALRLLLSLLGFGGQI